MNRAISVFLIVLLLLMTSCLANPIGNPSADPGTLMTTGGVASTQTTVSDGVIGLDMMSTKLSEQTAFVEEKTADSHLNPYYISGQSSRINKFDTADALNNASENIFAGSVISSDPVFCDGFLITVSCVRVDQVFKGKLKNGDSVYIGELGGRTTYGDYSQNIRLDKKAFEETPASISLDREVKVYYDGYSPMRVGDKMLLYANLEKDIDLSKIAPNKNYPAVSYYIVGMYDGKLFQTDDRTFVKPKPSKFGELTAESFEAGGALTITIDQLK